jgi:uncharacterized protein with HEPN domain
MSQDDVLYLEHMLEAAEKFAVRVQGRSHDEFDASEDFQMALAYLVQIIGEAASRVSQVTRDAHLEIPWKRIVGMRHRIVHDYLTIDTDLLWEVATTNVPELIVLLEPLVPDESAD